MKKALAAVLAAAGLALTGCVGYEVKPPKPAEMPRADAPSPLKVGVMTKTAAFEWGGMGMDRMEGQRGRSFAQPVFAQTDDIAGKFVRALKESGAFAQVDEIKSMGFFGSDDGGHDLFIDASFAGKYAQDPAMFPKAFLSGFLMFIPVPFVRYDDSYKATAELGVYDGEGRLLHKYSESQDAETVAALFSAGMPSSIAAGIESASANLAAKLAAEVIADRAGYQRAIAHPSGSASRKTARAAAPPVDDRDGPATARAHDAPDDRDGPAASPAAARPAVATDDRDAPLAAPPEAPEQPARKVSHPRIPDAEVAAELLP